MAAPASKIDRQTTTPFHLKLFYRTGSFHRLDEFPTTPSTPLPSHLQIYTWPTCTLRELSHLLVSAIPSLLPSPAIGTRLAYRLIFPDTRSSAPSAPARYISKELGSVVVGGDGEGGGVYPTEEEEKVVTGGVMSERLGGEPDKTLSEARFVVGDWVCCAIFEAGSDGGVAPPPRVVGRGNVEYGRAGGGVGGGRDGFGGSRENGYGGGYRGRGRGSSVGGGGFNGRLGGEGLPSGEWRRGERVPDGFGRGYRGRGRGY